MDVGTFSRKSHGNVFRLLTFINNPAVFFFSVAKKKLDPFSPHLKGIWGFSLRAQKALCFGQFSLSFRSFMHSTFFSLLDGKEEELEREKLSGGKRMMFKTENFISPLYIRAGEREE